jgi:hypothetical protein
MPEPVGADEFIGFERAIRGAMPNINHNQVILSEDIGGWVRGKVRVAGLHTGTLDLPFLAKVGPTKKSIQLPTERWTALVKDDKIVSLKVEVGLNGGLIGILKQMGRQDLVNCLGAKGADCRTIEAELRPETRI